MVKSRKEKVYASLNIILIVLLTLTFIVPVMLILSASVSTAGSFAKHGYSLFPKVVDFTAYKYVLVTSPHFVRSLGNTVLMTVIGTFLMIFTCTLYSFALTKEEFVGRKFFSIFATITMLFAGGTIPYYLVVTGIGLENTMWAIILPGSVNAWNILLIRNFFMTIPKSLTEASELDGATHLQVMIRVIFPTSFPVIATVILFTAVGFWNNWFGPLLFIDAAHRHITPIQALLREMTSDITSLVGTNSDLPTEGIKNAAVVVATVPIVIVYPMLQKYFINGVILGSVKE